MLTALIARLRRVTNGRPWIPEIDGLRFLAITGVLLFHLLGEVGSRSGRIIPMEPRYWLIGMSLGNGDRGVRLFFVISGLVLALPFARHFLAAGKPVSIRAYFLRRLTRLEPPYVCSVVLFVLLLLWYNGAQTATFYREALASLFYLHSPIYGTFSPVNMVAWSLEVEVQFYLVAPVFMQIFRIRTVWQRRSVFIALILLTIPVQPYVLGSSRLSFSIARYLGYFVAGLLAADFFVVNLPLWKEHPAWDIAAVFCGVFALSAPYNWEGANALLPFAFGTLCIAAMRAPIVRRCLATQWVAVIGGMCYSIYLLHMTVIAAVFKVSRHLLVRRFDFVANYLVQCVVLIPAVLVAASLFYLLIERPCMDPQWPLKLKRWILLRKNGVAVLTRS